MSVFSLKLIAVITMIIDHVGMRLELDAAASEMICTAMRSIGRVAFPIFCFLIVNGFEHSRDKKKYLTRLTLFALISEIPYTLAASLPAQGTAFGIGLDWYIILPVAVLASAAWFFYVKRDITAALPAAALIAGVLHFSVGSVELLSPEMNVFYTLALGFAFLCALERLGSKALSLRDKILPLFVSMVVLAAIGGLVDYHYIGVLILAALWSCRDRRLSQCAILLLWAFCKYPPFILPEYFIPAAIAAGLILLYNGKLGKKMQTAFYLVYPVHLAIIGIAAIII